MIKLKDIDMKTTINLILIFFFIGFISCEKGNDNTNQLDLSGKLIKNSTCKSDFKSGTSTINTPDTLSCIEYSYDNSSNKLTIKHINSGFNCCPDSLYCDVKLNSDTIIIKEFEAAALCKCNCLYDLNIELNGVTSKKYQVRFIEPYIGEQEQLIFEIDLTKDIDGSFCLIRKQYPWGEFSIHNEYN